jgi:ribosomal protein S3
MREKLLTALEKHALGHIEKHRINVEVYLTNPVGIGEHGDIIETVEKELEAMARYQDQLDILKKYFG